MACSLSGGSATWLSHPAAIASSPRRPVSAIAGGSGRSGFIGSGVTISRPRVFRPRALRRRPARCPDARRLRRRGPLELPPGAPAPAAENTTALADKQAAAFNDSAPPGVIQSPDQVVQVNRTSANLRPARRNARSMRPRPPAPAISCSIPCSDRRRCTTSLSGRCPARRRRRPGKGGRRDRHALLLLLDGHDHPALTGVSRRASPISTRSSATP